MSDDVTPPRAQPPEDDAAKAQALIESALGGWTPMLSGIRAYYEAAVEAGFDKGQAMMLTVAFQQMFLANLLAQAKQQGDD